VLIVEYIDEKRFNERRMTRGSDFSLFESKKMVGVAKLYPPVII
jgi:hypothetical protein